MIRVLFSVLAVVVAVLAVVLKLLLLYAIAAVLLLIVAILWIRVLQQRHRETATSYPPSTKAPPLPEEDLTSLGIMNIRPKAPSQPPAGGPNGASAEAPRPVAARPAPPLKEFVVPAFEARPIAAKASEVASSDESATPREQEALVLYMQALRAALGAHTAGLLKQADLTPDYWVEILVGDGGTVQRGGAFSAEVPLLTASRAREPVTVQRIGPGGLPPGSLGYSAAPETIREMALAPVPRASDPDTYFLLADTLRDDHLSQEPAPTLLHDFARLLGTLLDTLIPATTETLPRPRREIIAEEMEQARARNQLLALALVYLNRAEALANEGVVAEAEHVLAARLQQATGHRRIERFGELTYGVFYDGDLPEVEAWGAQIQQALADETGLLEGGVSIGIALLHDRHQRPEDLRADATEALREAYETGTCTILE